MRVSDVMTREVACCTLDDSLAAAARLMWDCDCGSVPVLESASGRAIGMITDRDICMATLFRDRSPSAVPVRDAMSRGLHACAPEDSIARAESLLRNHQIRRLPVLDDSGRPVGIISLADIVRAAGNGAGRRHEISSEEIADTLGVISRPRSPDARAH
jgi:CBS domain-containing protein